MEYLISSGIIDSWFRKFKSCLHVDVAVVGGGPSGLVAAYYLSRNGKNTAVFERKLAPGGGMWGGAMMFNEIIVQKEATDILNEFGIVHDYMGDDLYSADSVHAASALIYKATQAGVRIFNCLSVEDVVLQNECVRGLVVNWAPVHREGLHVDPLVILSSVVIDATGHDCEVARILEKKNKVQLDTPSGKVEGERSMNAFEAEKTTIENTKEIYPGLFVSGMAANGVSGSPRMGPIFGGMLLSGYRAASLILQKL